MPYKNYDKNTYQWYVVRCLGENIENRRRIGRALGSGAAEGFGGGDERPGVVDECPAGVSGQYAKGVASGLAHV